jgi:Opacity protein and related surface antigens
MKKLILAAVSAAALLGSGIASANAQSIEGPYAGAAGGYGLGVVDITDPTGTVNGAIQAGALGLDGAIFAGYGTTFDNVYLGIEGQVGYSDIKHKTDFGGANLTGRVQENAAIYARLGFSFAESSLIYGIAGLSGANYELSDGTTTIENTVYSYKLGAGIEQGLNENMFVRGSVDFDIAREDVRFNGIDIRPVTSAARIGLGFRF